VNELETIIKDLIPVETGVIFKIIKPGRKRIRADFSECGKSSS
jgi:hypothetical protein